MDRFGKAEIIQLTNRQLSAKIRTNYQAIGSEEKAQSHGDTFPQCGAKMIYRTYTKTVSKGN